MDAIIAVVIPVVFFLSITFVLGLGTTGNAYTQLQTQINALNCPMPQFQGSPYPFPNPTQFTNMTYNTQSANNQTLTLTCTPVHTPFGFDYCYGCPVANTLGFFIFAFDYISEGVHKVSSVFTIVFLAVTPPSSIPASISGIVFLFVYIPMYILLGFGIYKGVSPFAG